MNDLAFLEEYLAEPEAAAESSSSSIENMIASSKPEDSPLNVQPGEKVETAINENKQSGASSDLLQTKKNTEKIMGAAVPTLDDFPVPAGGIALLLFIALLMVFAISPAPGQGKTTRLSLLWGSILGNYSVNQSAGGVDQTSATSGTPTFTELSYIQGGLY